MAHIGMRTATRIAKAITIAPLVLLVALAFAYLPPLLALAASMGAGILHNVSGIFFFNGCIALFKPYFTRADMEDVLRDALCVLSWDLQQAGHTKGRASIEVRTIPEQGTHSFLFSDYAALFEPHTEARLCPQGDGGSEAIAALLHNTGHNLRALLRTQNLRGDVLGGGLGVFHVEADVGHANEALARDAARRLAARFGQHAPQDIPALEAPRPDAATSLAHRAAQARALAPTLPRITSEILAYADSLDAIGAAIAGQEWAARPFKRFLVVDVQEIAAALVGLASTPARDGPEDTARRVEKRLVACMQEAHRVKDSLRRHRIDALDARLAVLFERIPQSPPQALHQRTGA